MDNEEKEPAKTPTEPATQPSDPKQETQIPWADKSFNPKIRVKVPQSIPPSQVGELKSWALVELYGHARIVGLVTSNPIELPGTIRVDVPDLLKDGKIFRKGFTRYFGRGALYSITPCDEETVRQLLPAVDGAPFTSEI